MKYQYKVLLKSFIDGKIMEPEEFFMSDKLMSSRNIELVEKGQPHKVEAEMIEDETPIEAKSIKKAKGK